MKALSAGIVFMREALVRFSRHKPNFVAGLKKEMIIVSLQKIHLNKALKFLQFKSSNSNQLRIYIKTLIENFNPVYQLRQSATLIDYSLTEQQFAHMIGRCRMYPHLPHDKRKTIPSISLGNAQINLVCKSYYNDDNFARNEDGSISLWKLYNLLTGANKSSYIDNFLDRSVSAYQFIENIKTALQNKSSSWFLN